MLEQEVVLRWTHYAVHGPIRQKNGFKSQTVPCSFWPTRVAALDDHTIAVAGKRPRGATIVEVWRVDPPDTTDMGGGLVRLDPKAPRVGTAFEEESPGMDMVSLLEPSLGSEASLLVQFNDSKDVYELKWATGAMHLIASTTPSTAVLFEPGLDGVFTTWTANHSVLGYVYVPKRVNSSVAEVVLLRDGDRDGDIDGVESLDNAQWKAYGLGEDSLYLTQ